jgi:hypothetical protein
MEGDMKQAVKLLLWLLFMGCAWTSQATALQVVAEQRFASSQGEPVTQELLFNGSGFADFVLRVQNGAADGTQRVSSALVSLNGVKILAPADFNQNVQTLERAIAPLPAGNTLSVTVRSNPGAFLLVQVLGTPTFQLPPDPGPAGDATLEGVDSNGNGIRDDIERWIYLTYPDSEKLRRALIQEYYPLQNMIIHGQQQNRDAVYDDMIALQRSSECLYYVHPDKPHKISAELEARIVNTDDRVYGYLESSRLLGGGTFQGVPMSKWKNSCNFNPDEMKN